MPSAVGLILDRLAAIEKTISGKQTEFTPTDSRRVVDAIGLAKYLKRPISAVYQMEHRGIIQALRMPGSRKLYYDLDAIDAALTTPNHK